MNHKYGANFIEIDCGVVELEAILEVPCRGGI